MFCATSTEAAKQAEQSAGYFNWDCKPHSADAQACDKSAAMQLWEESIAACSIARELDL